MVNLKWTRVNRQMKAAKTQRQFILQIAQSKEIGNSEKSVEKDSRKETLCSLQGNVLDKFCQSLKKVKLPNSNVHCEYPTEWSPVQRFISNFKTRGQRYTPIWLGYAWRAQPFTFSRPYAGSEGHSGWVSTTGPAQFIHSDQLIIPATHMGAIGFTFGSESRTRRSIEVGLAPK